MNANTKPGERPQILGPTELVQALREKHAGGWRLSYRAAMRVVQEQYDFRRAAALSSPHPEAREEDIEAINEWAFSQATGLMNGLNLTKWPEDKMDRAEAQLEMVAQYTERVIHTALSRLATPKPEGRADGYEIGTPREFAERLAWMTTNGKPDLDQWENHIKFRDDALSRLAAQKDEGQDASTARDILRNWLKANGYAGLAGIDCGCGIDDLAPCGGDSLDCSPADYHKCDVDNGRTCEYEQDCNGLGCYRPRKPAAPEPRPAGEEAK